MIRAYHKVYLENARNNLGRMLDFATYDLGYDPRTFFDLFMKSGLAKQFEKGDFHVTVGMSGVELAFRVLELTKDQAECPQPRYSADRRPDTRQTDARNTGWGGHWHTISGKPL